MLVCASVKTIIKTLQFSDMFKILHDLLHDGPMPLQDQRISRISEDEPSHEHPFSDTSSTTSE